MKPEPLARILLVTVLRLGECSVERLVAAVGEQISVSQAAQRGRRLCRHYRRGATLQQVLDRGRRHLVANCLSSLLRRGLVRRVSHGVYAPPHPKLYETG